MRSKSNGIRVLHLLSKELIKNGYEAYMCTPLPHSDEYSYMDTFSDDIKKNAIVVYPETTVGNPLRFQNVVRYILNTPGVCGGPKHFHESERLFTWSKKYFMHVPELTIPCVDPHIFYNDNSPKTQDCVFVYKNGKFRTIPELENLVEINMEYPKKREELGKLLRTTEILYSYDDCSSIIYEAQLCGAKVKIITHDDIIDAPVEEDMLYNKDLFTTQLDYFIKETQAMNYTGNIQSNFLNPYKHIAAFFLISIINTIYYKVIKNEQNYKIHKEHCISIVNNIFKIFKKQTNY